MPTVNPFAAAMPPAVLIAPVVLLVESSVFKTLREPVEFDALPIVTVPVVLVVPMLIAVAAPNALTVKRPVWNNVSVPVLVLAKVGEAPLMFSAVAPDSVTVELRMVVVPDALAPRVSEVAAPKAATVVAVALNTFSVVRAVPKSPACTHSE